MELANKLFKGDRVIWIIFMLLCLISVVEVFSATSTIADEKRKDSPFDFKIQVTALRNFA